MTDRFSVSDQLPDVSDPDVREMVLRNHEPAEVWSTEKDHTRTVVVGCATCFAPWPCPSIRAARKADSASTD